MFACFFFCQVGFQVGSRDPEGMQDGMDVRREEEIGDGRSVISSPVGGSGRAQHRARCTHTSAGAEMPGSVARGGG